MICYWVGEEGAGFEVLGASVSEMWKFWARGEGQIDWNSFLTALAVNWWVIWNSRNKIVFQHRNADPLFTVSSVRRMLAHWKELG